MFCFHHTAQFEVPAIVEMTTAANSTFAAATSVPPIGSTKITEAPGGNDTTMLVTEEGTIGIIEEDTDLGISDSWVWDNTITDSSFESISQVYTTEHPANPIGMLY